jgi:N-acetylneuraminic acid mutarotase
MSHDVRRRRHALSLALVLGGLAAAGTAAGQSAVQIPPDGAGALITKDVAGQRWAISRNLDGTVTGNVFSPDGGPPSFVWCEQTGAANGEVMLSCRGADRCALAPCTPDGFRFVADVTLPASFFLPPGAGWRTLAPLALGARQEHPSVVLAGEIFVVGGFDGSARIVDSVEAYDPLRDAWRSDVAALPVALHHANVAEVNGRIYVAGFLRELGFEPDGRVFEYDPTDDRWRERRSMPPGSERGASGVAVIDGRIFVAGGLRGGTVATFSVYDPVADEWEPLPDLPLALDHLAAAGVGGIFYALGGRNGSIVSGTAATFAYDPATRGWTRRTDMPTARGGVTGVVLDGRIHVLGGEGNRAASSGVFPNVEAYDPATDSWEELDPMALPRHGVGAAAFEGRIYVPGGGISQGFGATATVDVLTPARSLEPE